MKRTALLLCIVGAGAALAPAVATAQSKKYPPVVPDKDLEAEQRSDLWEGALNPDMRPYAQLVRDAEQAIARNNANDTKYAFDKLGEAIGKMPNEAPAYLVRGRLHLTKRDYAKCADDLGVAEDRSREQDATARTRARLDLGVCLARANRVADAERVLVRAVAHATTHRAELGLRLGEARIALGKLDEAIDSLSAALEFSDIPHQMTRWLLAAAYDRARRPTEALEHATAALKLDPSRSYIDNPVQPHLGPGDAQYFMGIAYRYATPKPEYALLYFRQFAKLAPESPWLRRAEEHIRELGSIVLPARETITTTGPATVTNDDLRQALAKPMTTLRKCLASPGTSNTAYQITITKLGPKTPESRDRPLYRMPTPGVRVAPIMTVGDRGRESDLAAATKCLEIEGRKLKLPTPKDRDTWYMMSFLVVSP